MRRILGVILTGLVLFATGAQAGITPSAALDTPDTFGDQLIYYYDARADFTTFLTLRNKRLVGATISVLFYGPTIGTPFAKTVTLNGNALTTIDVGALRGSGLPAQFGVAIATVVNAQGQAIASGALSGSFTVANLATGSAFGAPGAARSAFRSDGHPLDEGEVLGPGTAILQRIAPSGAILESYFDPNSLAPVSASGNQLIFINFQDTYAPTYGATVGSTIWNVSTMLSNGTSLPASTFAANGVTVSDLASVAGAAVNGSAGGIQFDVDSNASAQNHFVYFAESLGTFGTGYLLPMRKGGELR